MFSDTLKTLMERREAAAKALEDFATPIIADDREMTDAEEAQNTELRAAVTKLDERITELEADERAAADFAERRSAVLGAASPTGRIKEARTYEIGSPNSYLADFIWASNPQYVQHDEARSRLAAHAAEVAGEMRDGNSAEGKRAARQLREKFREGNTGRRQMDEVIDRARAYTREETRTGMDTTSGSGGSFVTPQYFVADYAPFRQYGRQFADAATKNDLPDYGMTIYMPHVTNAAAVSAQTQNSGVAETDPNAAYLSTNLVTNAGQVTVSQQLLDRAGPNFAFDTMVFDQLQRAYNLTLDAYVLTTAVATATSVTSSYSSFGWQTLAQKVAGGKAAIADTAGTVMPATHIWSPVSTWEWAAAQIDASGGSNRAAAVPNYAGPFNAWAAGAPTGAAEGDTGYRFLNLPVFEDQNIPQDGSSHNQLLVTNQKEIWYWEGDLVMRTVPQTLAQNLSVLLQAYAYVGCIVRYPAAVQTVSGSALNVTF